MIRVAAVGDLHVGEDSAGATSSQLAGLEERADLLLLAGDLTRIGTRTEAALLADELACVTEAGLPVVTVLGNHDYHYDQQQAVADCMRSAGAQVLEGEATTIPLPGGSVGVAGVKGFGGGFVGACATEFGETLMKEFVGHTRASASQLREALDGMRADVRIALLHYSPVEGTLQGERPEIYPFLGSYLLAEAVDAAGADLVVHGHAHAGVEKAVTPGGIPVRNVAQPVLRAPYRVFCFEDASGACDDNADLVAAGEA